MAKNQDINAATYGQKISRESSKAETHQDASDGITVRLIIG